MRYTIEGFSQTEAIKFRRVEIVKDSKGNDKEKVVTLDCTDLVILRWFVDFWPNMMKVEIGGRQYAWLSYKAAIEDMPLLGIKKGMFALRLKKMVDFGILSHKTVKSGGTFSYYGFGSEYGRLIDTDNAQKNSDHAQDIREGVHNKLDTPAQEISDQINPSTKDPSAKDSKERKKDTRTYDEIVDGYTKDPDLRASIFEFIKARKMMKAQMTNIALVKMLSKLDTLSNTTLGKIEILDQSIINGWKGVFPLKADSGKPRDTLPESERLTDLDWIPDLS